MHAVAEKRVLSPATAWHCCLEFFSVATRLPPEFRVAPADAVTLLEEEVFARWRFTTCRRPIVWRCFAAQRDAIAGGRIHDSHIADVARASGARVVVTDNRRHFVSALRYDLRVETPAEFLDSSRRGNEAGR